MHHPAPEVRLQLARALPGGSDEEPVVSRLSVDDPDDIRLLEVKAAGELADPALLPVLGRLELAWAGEEDEHAQALTYARTRCQPEQRHLAPAVEARMLAMANERLDHAGLRGALVVTGNYPATVLLRTRADGSIDEAFGRHRVWDDTTPDAGELRVDLWIDSSLARLT